MATYYGPTPIRKPKFRKIPYSTRDNGTASNQFLSDNAQEILAGLAKSHEFSGSQIFPGGNTDAVQNMSKAPVKSTGTKSTTAINMKSLGKAAGSVIPYASNIINSFRKLPKPPAPHLDSQIALKHVNLNNDRAMVERGIRGENMNASKVLDENTAQAVRQANLGVRTTQLSSVNQNEANQNANIDNEAIKINAGIRAGNNAKLDNYDNANVERTVATQNNASANTANAVDKYIGIQNEQAKNDLDVRKFNILSKTDTNGTLYRNFQDDPLFKEWKKKQSLGKGGRINPVNAARPIHPKRSFIKPFDTKRMLPVLK